MHAAGKKKKHRASRAKISQWYDRKIQKNPKLPSKEFFAYARIQLDGVTRPKRRIRALSLPSGGQSAAWCQS